MNKNLLIQLLTKIVILLVLYLLITQLVFGFTRSTGLAMYPSVYDGDYLLYYRLNKTYEIGDIVVFDLNDSQRIARVIARGGDVIDYTEDGQLIINGNTQIEENIYYPTYMKDNDIVYPYTIPDDSLYVLCDNRTASNDSRDYGAISLDDIKGSVISIFRLRVTG